MRFFSVLRLTGEGVKKKKVGITFEKKIVNIKILNTVQIYLYLFISILCKLKTCTITVNRPTYDW